VNSNGDVFTAGIPNTFYKSTNGGLNWIDIGVVSSGTINDIKFINSKGYAVTSHGELFTTANQGTTWQKESSITNGSITTIGVLTENRVLLMGDYGITLRFENQFTSSEPNGNIVPENYKLEQNFPNPFNPSTSIKYSVPVNADVVIKIYDITGREVSTLVNAAKQAGTYEVNFDASHLASGVYLYRIDVQDISGKTNVFTSTKKMILIK
jgi:hypothetical protein